MNYRKAISFVIVPLLLVLPFACRTAKPVTREVPIQYREKIVDRLVEVQSPADSASIIALLKCDSLNRVIMTSLIEQKSKGVAGNLSLDRGVLKYNFKTSPTLGYARVRDSIVYQEVPVKVPVEVKVNFLSWWQKLWIGLGKGAAGIVTLLAVLLFIKSKIVEK